MLKAGVPRSFDTGLAAYVGVRDVAEERLRIGQTVVVDAVNTEKEGREIWTAPAAAVGVRKCVIEVTSPEPTEHRRRVETRSPSTSPLPRPSWEEVLRRKFAPWQEPVLSVEGSRPLAENIAKIVAHCQRLPCRGRGGARRHAVRVLSSWGGCDLAPARLRASWAGNLRGPPRPPG